MSQTTSGLNYWKVILVVFHTLFLFSLISADFTSYHLANYLNHSVSPCSNFHRHVCSIGMSQNETAKRKSEEYYWPALQHALNKNNPIMNDIILADAKRRKCSFDAESYMFNLRTRCGESFDCYLDEFYYFFNLYETMEYEFEDTLTFFASHANKTRKNIPRIVTITSKLIRDMTEDVDEDSFKTAVAPYIHLHARISIMSKFKQSKVTGKFYGLDKIRKMKNRMKKAVANRFMETSWLNETDAFDLDRLSQYLTTLKNTRIIPDFDKLDANVEMWRRFDRIITEKYFEYSKRSTGCARFDAMHPFLTLDDYIESNEEPRVTWVEFKRFKRGLVYNGFNSNSLNLIHIYAPTFYPLMWRNSSYTTQLGFAASLLGHEIFHSFIRTSNTNKEFNMEADCVAAHFNYSCNVWAEGACNSGAQTLTEDGPDLEGMRAAYELLLNKYTKEQLQEHEYEGINITRHQAFFYAYAVRSCGAGVENMTEHTDVHSASNIRVNGVASLMPEFTEAFGCKEGDEEYSEESTSCYIFGPLAGTNADDSSEEDEDEDGNDDDDDDDGSGEDEDEEATTPAST